MRFRWPLAGRVEELRIVEAAMSDPHLSGILISGPAGVGKSRIAREALDVAASHGCETRLVVGTSSAKSLPLGAFASWVGSSDTKDLHLVRGVIQSLGSATPGNRVIVCVDDVHLLDDLSSFVLHQIIQRSIAKVLLTFREGEPIPPRIQEIWKIGQFDRLDLQPLSRDETTALLMDTLGGPLDPDAARRLWKLTRGNVLYLRNIVEHEVGAGRLAPQYGCWTWHGEPVVPPSLVEMVESRIGSLSAAVRDVLDTLAVGEPLDLASLNRITDPAAVEDAEMRGLIMLDHVNDRAEARVAHPLYAKVRRNRAAVSRLRRLRGLVAAELADSAHSRDTRTVVRRATLSLESDLEPDPDLLVRAAEGALWLSDLPLADRLAAAAIRAGAGAEASFVRAHAVSWLSRGEEADAVLVDIPARDFTAADHARVAFLRATNKLWTLADPVAAKTLIDEAACNTTSLARACIDAFLTEYWAAMGKPEAAITASRGFTIDQLPDFVGAVTTWGLVVALGDAGRAADASAAAEVGYAIADRSFAAAHMRFTIADGHIGALLAAGMIAEAREVAARLRRQAADLPGVAQIMSTAVAGRAALGAGRVDAACSRLEPVVKVLLGFGEANGFGYRYLLPHTIALAMGDRLQEAADSLDALEEQRHPSWHCVDHEAALARAWVAGSQGAVSEAIRIASGSAENVRADGRFAAEVMCLQTAVQFGDDAHADRLAELESLVEGPRAGIAARFATALRAGDGADLDAVSHEFESMGDLIAAVDAAAHAAQAYRRQGLRGSALGCATRAHALAEQCGGATTPALIRAAEQLPLTDREREVVALIREGLSNRDLAQRLDISVRTIEGHIYRAMTKTGAAGREELAALLPPHHVG